MTEYVWTIPAFPLLSALILACSHKTINSKIVVTLGVASVGLSAVGTGLLLFSFIGASESHIQQQLWQWIPLGEHSINFGFYIDAFTLLMMSVITGVGWLIHWYAAAYMYEDPSLARFFVYMNLFVSAMLVLVMADNLVLLYLGWEGVGICSFLLIGFWYKKPENAAAAKKAFIVTRIGDTSMLLGLLLLFQQLTALDIQQLISSPDIEQMDPQLLWIACLLLLGGAAGKSAQLPLQTWLPDAMAGPTPVSALIHAATMVTAGVYLIARLHPIFEASPNAMEIVAWVGALTLVISGLAALYQTDLKRILAYSTVSQIGYMILALGAGAWADGAFHLMTHAFFKALLFLTAGSIILKMHHNQNIYQMGGLWKALPKTSLLLLIGLAGLTAIPGTSGFFSKEAILLSVWNSDTTNNLHWALAVFGAFLTSLYSFKLFFIVCFGPSKEKHQVEDFAANSQFFIPLVPLAILALLGGFISADLTSVFGQSISHDAGFAVAWGPVILSLLAIALAYHFYFPKEGTAPSQSRLAQFCHSGLGFDWLYHQLFTRPFVAVSTWNKHDVIDKLISFLAWFTLTWNEVATQTQNGKLRWYATGILMGLLVMTGIALWTI